MSKKKALKIYKNIISNKQVGNISDLNKYIEEIAVEMYSKGLSANKEDFIITARRAYCKSCAITRSCPIKYSCDRYAKFSKMIEGK